MGLFERLSHHREWNVERIPSQDINVLGKVISSDVKEWAHFVDDFPKNITEGQTVDEALIAIEEGADHIMSQMSMKRLRIVQTETGDQKTKDLKRANSEVEDFRGEIVNFAMRVKKMGKYLPASTFFDDAAGLSRMIGQDDDKYRKAIEECTKLASRK